MDAYRAPQSTLEREPIAKRKTLGKILAWLSLGAILILPGVYFSWGQIISLYLEFDNNNIASSNALASRISEALVAVSVSTIVALPSLLCIFLSIAFSSYRSRIFYRFWVFMAMVWIIAVPIGSLFGLVLALTLYFSRKGFRKSQKWPYI